MNFNDAYLDLMDWLESKGIPKIAFWAIIAVIALALVLVLLHVVLPQTVAVNVVVKDEKGQLIGNQSVEIKFGEKTFTEKTNLNGNLTVKVGKGEKITFTVRRTGFESVSKTIIAESEENSVLLVLKKPAVLMPKKINITISGPDDALLSGKEVQVKLSCPTNPAALSEQESIKTTSEGVVSVIIPKNCGLMYADFFAEGFQEIKGLRLLQAETKVKLSAIEIPKGKVIVKITNDAGEIISGISFNVALLDSEGILSSQETSTGITEFLDVEKKEYNAVITDDSGMFENARTETKNLIGDYITLTAKTRRQTKGFLAVKVVDAETNNRIANAVIKVLDKNGSIIATVSTDSFKDKNIALFDFGSYLLQVVAEDYLPFEKSFEFNSGKTFLEARMEKCSESLQNCGRLEVKVIDEDNLSLENAIVSVYNAETQLLAGLQPKATDFNGIVVFSNLKKGKYFLRAVKYPAEKKDFQNVFSIDPKIPAKQTIRMEIGNGKIAVIVKDNEGNPIPNAIIEFRTSSGKECPKSNGEACIVEASTQGIAEFEFKADKKVYAIVSKENYSRFESTVYQVFKNQTIIINAELRKEISGSKPQMSIIGVFGIDGISRKNELKAGEKYVVKFKLDIPANINPKSTGFFIMTGNNAKGSILENDALYLRSIDASNITMIKGTTWNPNNGQDIDLSIENLAGEEFKWASVEIKKPQENTTYIINAEIKVRENTPAGTALMLYYRAWVESKDNEIIREPFDERLGTATETSSIQGLYAKTKEKIFYEGKSALCKDESGFCYYDERVFDELESLSLSEPYNLKVFQTYILKFEIANISGKEYGEENNARFRFKNSEDNGATLSDILQIIDYNFTNANFQQNSQTGLNAFEIPELQVKQMAQNKSISMSMRFKPKKTGYSSFLLQIIASNEIVFEKEINFNVRAQERLEVSVMPEFFGAFVSNDFNVIVKDSKGIEQENALVSVKKITPDFSESIIGSKRTNKLGIASFTAQASSQGTKIMIIAEKEGFEPAVLEKKIDENILVFNPKKLESRLALKGMQSQELQLSIQNKIPITLVLVNARIGGNFEGFLDEETMANFLSQFINNLSIEASSSKILTVKTAISSNALIEEEKTVNGFVHLKFSSLELGKTWAFNVPLKAVISVGEAVEEKGCLNVSLKQWTSITQESLASKEFTISNNCKIEGLNTEVNYLKARLKWISNPMGSVQVKILDSKTGNTSVELLRDNDWITLFDKLKPSTEQEYPAVITFTPSQGHLNEEAVFRIEFDAFTPTDKGLANVGSSNSINAEILITTLTECVKFEPDTDTGIRIRKGEDEETFTISTQDCGDLPIEFRFCQDSPSNQNCKGGSSEGGIEVSPWTTAKLNRQNKQITVRRQKIEGFYDITIEARAPGRNWIKIADFPVIIEPKEGKYFYLDKYNFILLGKGSKDSATLFNTQLEEEVEVTSNLCNWQEAGKNKNFAGQGAMTGTMGLAGAVVGGTALVGAAAGVAGGLGGLGGILGANVLGSSSSLISGAAWAGHAVSGITTASGVTASGIGSAAIAGAQSALNSLFSAISSFLGALGPVGIIITIVMLLASMFGGGMGQDCQEQTLTETLQDFVINLSGTMDKNYERYLPPDAQEIMFSEQKIKAEWNLEERDTKKEANKKIQTVGINLENLGIEKPEASFGILTVKATEHIHGDAMHSGNAKVKCKSGKFGMYWIGQGNQGKCSNAYDIIYEQKFHLKAKTMETKQNLQEIELDTLDCSTSTLIGRTGNGVLPKIKLDWSWISKKGIDWDSCDANNPNAIYCDATQFSIALTKRMYLLDEFLRKNKYFADICPTQEPRESKNQNQALPADLNAFTSNVLKKIRIKSAFSENTAFNAETSTHKTRIVAVISNNSENEASVGLNVEVKALDNTNAGNCNIQSITIPAYSEVQKSCDLTLEPGNYYANLNLSNNENLDIDSGKQVLPLMVSEKTQQDYDLEQVTGCSLKRSTEIKSGKPIINAFIEKAGGFNNGVMGTAEIPNLEALNKMWHFDALLMKDAFSNDFRQDFVEYYTTQSIADAPSFFKDDLQGFKKYFLDSNHLKFSNKYFESERISAAGTYRVDIDAVFSDDWRLFDSNGALKANINVKFYLQKEPNPNSPFYSTPFDGMIGIQGDSFNRQGYGTQYQNLNDSIIIDNSVNPAKTGNDSGSNAVNVLKTRIETSLKNLNNDLTMRGNLLSIETKNSSEKELVFSGNLATPVMMKITAEKSTEPFKAFYSVLQGNTPVTVGDSLVLWSAGGNCYDFTGIPLVQAFDEKPDRKATQKDNINGWEKLYGIEWSNVEMPGSTYLKTIFYTPKSTLNYLHAAFPTDSIEFFTPDSQGTNVNLGGISTMPKNNPTSSVKTLQDVFELVEEGKMCVTSTGTKARFWWNPKIIYDMVGQQRSISAMSKNLKPGTDCIG